MDTYETGTGYRILPVVGFIDSKFVPIINRDEVAETFEVPFEFIMNEDNHQLQSGEWKGVVRNYYTITYQGYNICLLYTSPSPRDATLSRMPSSA